MEKKEIQTNAFFISSAVWTHHNSVFRGQAYVAISLHLFQMFVYLFTHVYMCKYVPHQKHKCLLKQNNDFDNTEATNKRINVSAVILLTIRKLNHN